MKEQGGGGLHTERIWVEEQEGGQMEKVVDILSFVCILSSEL